MTDTFEKQDFEKWADNPVCFKSSKDFMHVVLRTNCDFFQIIR